jgi:hypothetical protein
MFLDGPIWWLLAVPMPFVVGWVVWRRRGRRSPYIIGEQMAQARAAEEQRLSKPNIGPSPLPTDLNYGAFPGEFSIADPKISPLDNQLADLCHRFAGSGLTGRSQLRHSASMDDFYTLLLFGKRSAVFAMRTRDKKHVVDGLTAVAMIEQDRIDFQDALSTLSLLHHAIKAIGANPADLFLESASLAEPKMSKLILGFLKGSEDYKDIQKSWGYTVVETKGGPGFLGWSTEPYQPTYPMDQIAFALASYLEKDQNQPTSITLASNLPAVWLSSADNRCLNEALKSVRAAVTVDCGLRFQKSNGLAHQTLMIFLVEVSDEAAAGSLLRMSGEKRSRPADHVMVGVKVDRLFCLAVQRSFVAGEPPFETTSTIERLSKGISAVLKLHVRT